MIIDVSSAQGTINWKKVKDAGVTAVILKICSGVGTIDSRLYENYTGATAQGLTISYYHCIHPDERGGNLKLDAESEANYILNAFSKLGNPYRIWADLENWDESGKNTPFNKDRYSEWLKIYFDIIDNKSNSVKSSGIYGSTDYINSILPKDHSFGVKPLWLANYSDNKNPKLPIGWDKAYMRQYTAKGKVDGISTPVDLSVLL